jgi:hypothetical protein
MQDGCHSAMLCASCTCVVFCCVSLAWCREVRKCEKPIYTVIRPLGSRRNWWDGKSPAELRQYAPMLIAQVAGQSHKGSVRAQWPNHKEVQQLWVQCM